MLISFLLDTDLQHLVYHYGMQIFIFINSFSLAQNIQHCDVLFCRISKGETLWQTCQSQKIFFHHMSFLEWFDLARFARWLGIYTVCTFPHIMLDFSKILIRKQHAVPWNMKYMTNLFQITCFNQIRPKRYYIPIIILA